MPQLVGASMSILPPRNMEATLLGKRMRTRLYNKARVELHGGTPHPTKTQTPWVPASVDAGVDADVGVADGPRGRNLCLEGEEVGLRLHQEPVGLSPRGKDLWSEGSEVGLQVAMSMWSNSAR